ncbi:MAG: sensor histidine kinase [Propioniciclava sp.]
MRRGTLSRQLTLRTTALVALIAVFLSGLTAIAMHAILERQLDNQLLTNATSIQNSPFHDDDDDDDDRIRPPGGGFGQTQGLLVYIDDAVAFVQVGRERQPLTREVVGQLASLAPSREPRSIRLAGLGGYRVLVSEADGHLQVVGQPTALITASMTSILLAAGLLTVVAILIAYLAARQVVARSLAPLARLAGTAHQVSSLELTTGEVAVPVRVPAADTDPRSEVGQVGLAFNHMLDKVEGALAARQRSETKVRQFVADASHELRNPLAAIRGYAELTRRNRAELPEDTQHALARIDSESARMARLVEDLLLLARLDAGPNIQVSDVAMNDLVANAVSDAQVAGPDHTWIVHVPTEPVIAVLDRHRIHQVVVNLLANARTHTPPGTTVVTTLHTDGARALLTIDDDGPGIPEEIRPTLFARFTRADTARVRSTGTSSTGLGLAIVAAVVAAHRGQVSASASPTGGARFTVALPLGHRSS